MPGPAKVFTRLYLSDGRVLTVQAGVEFVRSDLTRAMRAAPSDKTPTTIYPMVNLPIPESWTPERGCKYFRINAWHVVQIEEA